jgi:hypothetical protein
MVLTNEQNEPVCRSCCAFLPLNFEESHARHDGADKINIKYGQNVDEMESHGYGQKPKTSDARHDADSPTTTSKLMIPGR